MERNYYSHSEIESIASRHNLGSVHFQFNLAQNTGRYFEVGYVFVDGRRNLFCKTTPLAEGFYLCNDFSKLN